MDELIAFLRQRLDIEERRARAVKPLGYTDVLGGQRLDEMFALVRLVPAPEDGAYVRQRDGDAEVHFLCHDPERVLADVAAKRAVIAACAHNLEYEDYGYTLAERVLRALALPYAEHEDYKPHWRPRDE